MATVKEYLGVNFTLKLKDDEAVSPGTFTQLGGLKSTDVSIMAGFYDATSNDGSRFTKKVAGGLKSVSFSGGGLWKNQATQKTATLLAFNGEIRTWQVVAENGDTWTGQFAISDYKRTGSHDGLEEFSLSLESAGDVTFTAGAA
jgi:TP901-1 family phage major tail protein